MGKKSKKTTTPQEQAYQQAAEAIVEVYRGFYLELLEEDTASQECWARNADNAIDHAYRTLKQHNPAATPAVLCTKVLSCYDKRTDCIDIEKLTSIKGTTGLVQSIEGKQACLLGATASRASRTAKEDINTVVNCLLSAHTSLKREKQLSEDIGTYTHIAETYSRGIHNTTIQCRATINKHRRNIPTIEYVEKLHHNDATQQEANNTTRTHLEQLLSERKQAATMRGGKQP